MKDTTLILIGIGKVISGSYNMVNRVINACNGYIETQNRCNRNYINRGIVEHPSLLNIEDCFCENSLENRIVLGNSRFSDDLIIDYINKQHNDGMTVILHSGDVSLIDNLKNKCQRNIVNIDSRNKIYDFFAGLKNNQIVKLIYDIGVDKYGFGIRMERYLEGMLMLFDRINKLPCLKMFIDWPYGNEEVVLHNAVDANLITYEDVAQISVLLREGEEERYKIKRFFEDLYRQSRHIIDLSIVHHSNSCCGHNNIINFMDEASTYNKIYALDIKSVNFTMLIDFISKQLLDILEKGININLVLCQLNIREKGELLELITNSNNCALSNLMIVTKDLYNDCNSNDKVFYKVLGMCKDRIIHSHNMGIGVSKLSEEIGYYEMEEETISVTHGSLKSFMSFFPTYQDSKTSTINYKRKLILPPEEIRNLQENEIYLFRPEENKIVHTWLNI